MSGVDTQTQSSYFMLAEGTYLVNLSSNVSRCMDKIGQSPFTCGMCWGQEEHLSGPTHHDLLPEGQLWSKASEFVVLRMVSFFLCILVFMHLVGWTCRRDRPALPTASHPLLNSLNPCGAVHFHWQTVSPCLHTNSQDLSLWKPPHHCVKRQSLVLYPHNELRFQGMWFEEVQDIQVAVFWLWELSGARRSGLSGGWDSALSL